MGRQPRGRCGHLAPRLLPCPQRSRSDGRSARRPGLPGRAAAKRRRPRTPGPGPPPTPDDRRATRKHRPRQGPQPPTGPLDGAAVHRDLDPVLWRRCPPPRPGPRRHRLRWEETGASGRTGADTRRAGHRTAGHRTGGRQTGGQQPAGCWTGGQQPPGPPDPGRRHQVTGHRTGWTPDGRRRIPDDEPGWVDTACWTRTAHRRRLGELSTQDSSAARTPKAPRYGLAWPPPRQSAAGATPPSNWRLGAMLSSERLGSRVARDGDCHPLWRVRLSVDGGQVERRCC
jgi:hypothetical protein